jgi:hypothetical protein
LGQVLNYFLNNSRTAQISSLSQLVLDPYFRTLGGFSVLIEKEWISFGHRFKDRLGILQKGDDQISPIFLQFIDCVFHIWQQFPQEFEFDKKLLLFLAEQSYSCIFGNFLFNNEQEALKKGKLKNTISIWTFVNQNRKSFTNTLHGPRIQTIVPDPSMKKLSTEIWSIFYLYPGMRSKYEELMEKQNLNMNEKVKKLEFDVKVLSSNHPTSVVDEDLDDETVYISNQTPRVHRIGSVKILENYF